MKNPVKLSEKEIKAIESTLAKGERVEIIGSNVEYAAFVELGTSRMRARPYLRPACENHTDEYKSLVEAALKS